MLKDLSERPKFFGSGRNCRTIIQRKTTENTFPKFTTNLGKVLAWAICNKLPKVWQMLNAMLWVKNYEIYKAIGGGGGTN